MEVELSVSTLLLICIICFFEGADLALWGTSLRAWEVDLKINLQDVGVLEMIGGLSMALSGAFWAVFSDSNILPRKTLLVAGCSAWGLVTASVSTASSLALLVCCRVMVFCLLGCFIPLTQSIIVDISTPENRGRYFALLGLSTTIGVVTSQILSTRISNHEVHGTQGWRVSFVLVGVSSMIVAFLLAVFGKIPEGAMARTPATIKVADRLVHQFREMLKLFRVPSFAVIVAQGCFGGTAVRVMHYNVLWYQYNGVTDSQAGYLASLAQAGALVGNICGGCFGDLLSYWSRWHGRALMASATVLCAIPIVRLLYGPSTRGESLSFADMAPLVFLLGFSTSWTVAGCNRPVLAEIAPSKATTMALEYAMEVSFASICGPAIVTIGARRLGYESSTSQVSRMEVQDRKDNASALGATIMLMATICYAACASLYCLLHLTYRMDATIAAAAQRQAKGDDEKTVLRPHLKG